MGDLTLEMIEAHSSKRYFPLTLTANSLQTYHIQVNKNVAYNKFCSFYLWYRMKF